MITKEERNSIRLAYEFMFSEYTKIKRSRDPFKEDRLAWIKEKMGLFQSATKKLGLKFDFIEKFNTKGESL